MISQTLQVNLLAAMEIATTLGVARLSQVVSW
jgi:hypothetical protein